MAILYTVIGIVIGVCLGLAYFYLCFRNIRW